MSEPEVFALSLSRAHNRDFYIFYYHCRAYQLFHRSEIHKSLYQHCLLKSDRLTSTYSTTIQMRLAGHLDSCLTDCVLCF